MHCWGEPKSLRVQSVGEVSAYWSCVQFSGYVEMEVSQAYNMAKKLATHLLPYPKSNDTITRVLPAE